MNPSPLSLDDRAMVNDYLRRFPPEISELTFTNLYVWRQSRPVLTDIVHNSLIFFTQTPHGLMVLGNPAGPASLADILHEYGGRIVGVDRFPKAMLTGQVFPSGTRIIEDRDNADYVYRRHDLATLAGRNFSKKRNHINQCLSSYACCYEIITPEVIPECLTMQDRWCAARDCHKEPGLCGEYLAITETLRHYHEFGLTGGAIRIDGTVEAFTVGEALNPTTAVCHFEKAMAAFQGLGQLINQRFADNNLAGFTFINREQDLGIAGLRRAKESYHPDHLVEKVRLIPPGGTIEKPNPEHVCA